MVVAWHRTKTLHNAMCIDEKGYEVGRRRVLHGFGLYLSRDLYDRQAHRDQQYGRWAMKYEVNTKGFLNLEACVSLKKAKSSQFKELRLQAVEKLLNRVCTIKLFGSLADELRAPLKKIMLNKSPQTQGLTPEELATCYSSQLFKHRKTNFKNKEKAKDEFHERLQSNYKGIIYTGRGDGKCFLVYDLSQATFVSVYTPTKAPIPLNRLRSITKPDVTEPGFSHLNTYVSTLEGLEAKNILEVAIYYHAFVARWNSALLNVHFLQFNRRLVVRYIAHLMRRGTDFNWVLHDLKPKSYETELFSCLYVEWAITIAQSLVFLVKDFDPEDEKREDALMLALDHTLYSLVGLGIYFDDEGEISKKEYEVKKLILATFAATFTAVATQENLEVKVEHKSFIKTSTEQLQEEVEKGTYEPDVEDDIDDDGDIDDDDDQEQDADDDDDADKLDTAMFTLSLSFAGFEHTSTVGIDYFGD